MIDNMVKVKNMRAKTQSRQTVGQLIISSQFDYIVIDKVIIRITPTAITLPTGCCFCYHLEALVFRIIEFVVCPVAVHWPHCLDSAVTQVDSCAKVWMNMSDDKRIGVEC